MDESENAFPMDFYVRDPSPRPWKFRPKGYLVVILSDAEEGQQAEADLVSNGFAPQDVKLYTGKQILENYEVYVSRRTTTDKVVGSIVDDSEGPRPLPRLRASRSLCDVGAHPGRRGRPEGSTSPRGPRLRSCPLLRLPTDRLQGLSV
jgi:hypothetical protein